jgi:hypothetical protein
MAGRRIVAVLVGLALVVGVAAGGYLLVRGGDALLGEEDGCEVKVGDDTVGLDLEQAENAAIISGVAVRRRLPVRAVSVALATAYQESKIINVDYGDRDSLGLFQQRPSQGWGSVEEVQDPHYSTRAFYDALVQVDDYRRLRIHDAAQEVQRSADGSAYEQHEDNARTLATALTGREPATVSCQVDAPEPSGQPEGEDGLTDNARRLRDDVRATFGRLPDGGYAPGGVRTGHAEGSAHYEGRAVDFFFRPVGGARTRRGWALAHYVVARATDLEVETVIFDERIWTARRSDEGWRAYEVSGRSGDEDILLHRDHVHVDVA